MPLPPVVLRLSASVPHDWCRRPALVENHSSDSNTMYMFTPESMSWCSTVLSNFTVLKGLQSG